MGGWKGKKAASCPHDVPSLALPGGQMGDSQGPAGREGLMDGPSLAQGAIKGREGEKECLHLLSFLGEGGGQGQVLLLLLSRAGLKAAPGEQGSLPHGFPLSCPTASPSPACPRGFNAAGGILVPSVQSHRCPQSSEVGGTCLSLERLEHQGVCLLLGSGGRDLLSSWLLKSSFSVCWAQARLPAGAGLGAGMGRCEQPPPLCHRLGRGT